MSVANIDSTKLAKPSGGYLERLPTGGMIFKPFPRERVLAPPVAQDEYSDLPSAPPVASQKLRSQNIPSPYERPGTWPRGRSIAELPSVGGIIEGPERTVHPLAIIGGDFRGDTQPVQVQPVTPRHTQPQRETVASQPLLPRIEDLVQRIRGQRLRGQTVRGLVAQFIQRVGR